ncbi:MAG: glycosyltransferase family 39 protein [Planctomycetales bacterium]|nr:glycosyltransferase family 39 protein [Planctomycetales bacterium]
MSTAVCRRSLLDRFAAALDGAAVARGVRRFVSTGWPYALLAVLAVYPATRSWRTGLDPLVDFGRELYVPWRLAAGDVLYRDVAYFNGPLSPYLNATWFKLFGANLTTLMVANLAVLAITTALLFRMLQHITTRGAALAATALMPLLFGFGNYGTIANYNFITPYSHELTHGLLLALLALASSWEVTQRGGRAALVAGLFLGATLLTKPEIAVAAAAGVGTSVVALGVAEGTATVVVIRRLTLAATGTLVAPLIALVLMTSAMPLPEAFEACTAAWRMAAMAEIRQLDFYRECVGTLDLGMSLRKIFISLAQVAGVIAVAEVLDRRVPSDRRRWLALLLGLLGGFYLIVHGYYWPIVERGLPVWVAALVCWWAWRVWVNRPAQGDAQGESGLTLDPVRPQRDPALRGRGGNLLNARRLAWCVFALALLGKIALFSRVMHYGFVLALPAAITGVVAAIDWLPRRAWVRRRRATLPWLFLPLLAIYLFAYQVQQARHIHRDVQLGLTVEDRFDSDVNAAAAGEALAEIVSRVAPDETVTVLPEGVMLDYLARRSAGTKYITWMPPEVLFFGEAAMLADLAASAPNWIVLAPRNLGEYGYRAFGDDYCVQAAQWIAAHYETAAAWDDGRWRLMRRRASDPRGS